MEIFLASNIGSDHKIMAVVEKEKVEEAKEAKVEKAEKVVVAAECNNRQITVVAERATVERPNTSLANCATRMGTTSPIARS